jgi:lysophospholipase L1-like esterase
MAPGKVQNAGFANDRIENVLWRICHGELDSFKGGRIIVMIGTNNLAWNEDQEMLERLSFLVKQIKFRCPQATVYLGAILPRRNMLKRVLALNAGVRRVALNNHCKFFDLSKSFMTRGKLNDILFTPDGLHPNENGYNVLGNQIRLLL